MTPGSDEDFDRLYRESYPGLVRTLSLMIGDPIAAEDCVQETFVRAYRSWPRWRPEAPVGAWLHRIAVNVAYSYLRKRRLQSIGEVLRIFGPPQPGPDPAIEAERSELAKAMAELPMRQRTAVVLRFYSGYSNRELAALLGVTERTIGRELAKALDRLRARLGVVHGIDGPTPGASGVMEVIEP